MEASHGTLLGGRVRYRQPLEGWRTGIEPVLLAAAVPAQAGERVLEAGTGAGAGLLCLMARVAGLEASGLELDPGMAALARANVVANGMSAVIHEADVAAAARFGPVDHAFANPPWHDPASTRPSGGLRALAKQRAGAGLGEWVGPLAAALGPRGTLTLVLPAAMTGEAVSLLLARGLGRVALCPLWPRLGVAAKLILVQGRRGRPASRVGAGLVLHEGAGYSAAAEGVLRGGGGLAP